MTELSDWIKANNVTAVKVQTDTDDNTSTTRPLSVVADGDTIFLNGHNWTAGDNVTDILVSTDTLFVVELPESTVTIHKV